MTKKNRGICIIYKIVKRLYKITQIELCIDTEKEIV